LEELRELKEELESQWQEMKGGTLGRMDQIEARLDEFADDFSTRLQKTGLDRERPSTSARGRGQLLTLEEGAASHFRAQVERQPDYDPERVRFGALIAALAGGQGIVGMLNDAEIAALGEITGPGGSYLVPELIAGFFIDQVRPRTQVLNAGAFTYPMEAPTVALPGWDDPITAGWRAEGEAFHEADPKFRKVTLQAKTISTSVTLSIELIEDAIERGQIEGIVPIVESEMSKALAQAIDLAALHGSGVDSQPMGLDRTPDVWDEVFGSANGDTPTDWDLFLDATYAVEAQNFEPTAMIWNPRTANTMRKLVTGLSGDKTKLEVPERIRELRTLATTQVSTTETVGSSSDCSIAFVGDFEQMVVGFRPNLSVRSLYDPYSKGDSGLVVIRSYLRADVALLHPEAFTRLRGIRA
jgi:HK97 family phage major capsid protein